MGVQSFALWDERKLQMFEIEVLIKIPDPKKDEITGQCKIS
jgi:hypothetical protein